MLLLLLLAACSSAPKAGTAIHIAMKAGDAPDKAVIEITGLSPAELKGFRESAVSEEKWIRLLRVSVATSTGPPVVGSYVLTSEAIEFRPLFPFDPGRAYAVRFDTGQMPDPSWPAKRREAAIVDATVSLPGRDLTPTTAVDAIFPAAEEWPANLLRIYVQFSAPMGRAGATGRVTLKDEAGKEVAGAFLPLEADFWNSERTRYTVFFDPGRVKQGILPNQQMGRPLQTGHRYAIEVDAAWQDAEGRALKSPFRREFRVGPAVERPLVVSAWKIDPPAPSSRDPLTVTFPAPLDHALLQRALGVSAAGGRAIDGEIRIGGDDTRWLFTPREPWAAGSYQLVVLSILEDPSGNRIGRAFEVGASDQARGAADGGRLLLPFTIAQK